MFFSDNELSLELLGVFKLERCEYFKESNHNRNYDSISIRISGTGKFNTAKQSFSVSKGDVLYLPKNAKYSQSTHGETIYAIHFINYSFSSKNTVEIISPEDFGYVEEIVTEMYNEWKEKKQGYRYKCTSLFYSLIHYFNVSSLEHSMDAAKLDSRFKNAVDYIHTHFRGEDISVTALADMCNVSEAYFRRQFKNFYSLSPSQYIINLRLECASQLLESGLYTITEVAEKSGFNDTKYFSRVFKNHFKQTPREFQNNPGTK